MRVVTDNLGFLLGGLLVTLELTVLGFIGALLLGTVLAVFRVSPVGRARVEELAGGNSREAIESYMGEIGLRVPPTEARSES